jgi:hypothetical protein
MRVIEEEKAPAGGQSMEPFPRTKLGGTAGECEHA